MSRPEVGVSILTNGARRQYLERCVYSLLENCYYRPLCISIYNNGSTDDTEDWLVNLPETYGVTWRVLHNKTDEGCAQGTNQSIELVDYPPFDPCKYQLHLESDFIHMPEAQTGVDKFWLHRAVEFMETGACDYLYLRRMEGEHDIFQHWWSQWMPKLEGDGEHLKCDGFWWSNNPSLFRTEAMKSAGTLPLNVTLDGNKGEEGWSQPELKAPRPPNAYIHHWGMFAHEAMEPKHLEPMGCGKFPAIGSTTCKYGFYKDGKDKFCQSCDLSKSWDDMPAHVERFKEGKGIEEGVKDIAVGTVVVDDAVLQRYLMPCLNGDFVVDAMVVDAEEDVPISMIYNKLIESSKGRFLILCHPDVEFSADVYERVREQLSLDHVGVVGLVGVRDDGSQMWAGDIQEPKKLSALDGCFIAIDIEKGLRFDETTFDGLHCYAEDLCYQARSQGLKVVCLPAKRFKHHSDTLKKEGPAWGNYHMYRQRLHDKWVGKMRVVTT